VQGSSTSKEPVLFRVATIGLETIIASSASSMRLDAVKVTVPDAAVPVLLRY
jgi:hypothetical protein